MQKLVSQTLRARKADEKTGVICLAFWLLFELRSLNCPKLYPLTNFARVCKKSKAVIAIYVYASDSSCPALLENGVSYYAVT